MSTYARQFLERMQRPDVDSVAGVPPAIAIEQRNGVRNARSTVGTVTEITDYLRLLFARVGEMHCPSCGALVARDTAQAAADRVLAEAAGGACTSWRGRRSACAELLRNGYHRLFVDGAVVELEAADTAHSARCRCSSIASRSPPTIGRAWPTRSTRRSRSAAGAPRSSSRAARRSRSTRASRCTDCGTRCARPSRRSSPSTRRSAPARPARASGASSASISTR